jgi:hypothetical protein
VPVGAPALRGAEVGELERDRLVPGLARGGGPGVGGEDPAVAEADHVRGKVTADVADDPGVLVDAPPLGVAEVADLQGGLGERVPERREVGDVGAGVAEAHDVGRPVAVHVGEHPGVLVDPPPAVPAVAVDPLAGAVEGAVRPAVGDGHAGVPEADDVRRPIPGEVGQFADVPVDPPALVPAEVADLELRRGEAAVGLRVGDDHAGVAEADEVVPAVAVDVGDRARVPVGAPALRGAEVAGPQHRRGERAVGLAQGDEDAGVAEGHDVGAAVPVDVGELAHVLADPPAVDVGEEPLGGHGVGRSGESDAGGGQRRRGEPGEQPGRR